MTVNIAGNALAHTISVRDVSLIVAKLCFDKQRKCLLDQEYMENYQEWNELHWAVHVVRMQLSHHWYPAFSPHGNFSLPTQTTKVFRPEYGHFSDVCCDFTDPYWYWSHMNRMPQHIIKADLTDWHYATANELALMSRGEMFKLWRDLDAENTAALVICHSNRLCDAAVRRREVYQQRYAALSADHMQCYRLTCGVTLGDQDYDDIAFEPAHRKHFDEMLRYPEKLRKRCRIAYGGRPFMQELGVLAMEHANTNINIYAPFGVVNDQFYLYGWLPRETLQLLEWRIRYAMQRGICTGYYPQSRREKGGEADYRWCSRTGEYIFRGPEIVRTAECTEQTMSNTADSDKVETIKVPLIKYTRFEIWDTLNELEINMLIPRRIEEMVHEIADKSGFRKLALINWRDMCYVIKRYLWCIEKKIEIDAQHHRVLWYRVYGVHDYLDHLQATGDSHLMYLHEYWQ